MAGTRAQSGDRYGSGTLHSRQFLRGRLPLLSPAFRRSPLSPLGASTCKRHERPLSAKDGITGEKWPVNFAYLYDTFYDAQVPCINNIRFVSDVTTY